MELKLKIINMDSLTFTQLLLKKLAEIGHGTINAFFPAKYPEARMWRKLLGLDPSYVFSKKKISSLLSKLKKQGLVERQGGASNSIWRITPNGRRFLRTRGIFENIPKPDGFMRIVIFDIP